MDRILATGSRLRSRRGNPRGVPKSRGRTTHRRQATGGSCRPEASRSREEAHDQRKGRGPDTGPRVQGPRITVKRPYGQRTDLLIDGGRGLRFPRVTVASDVRRSLPHTNVWVT